MNKQLKQRQMTNSEKYPNLHKFVKELISNATGPRDIPSKVTIKEETQQAFIEVGPNFTNIKYGFIYQLDTDMIAESNWHKSLEYVTKSDKPFAF